MKLKSVKQIKNLKDKRVLVRCDFDVPLEKGRVVDDSRLRACLPTIEYLLKKKAKIILIGHAGRPSGKVVKDLSLLPIKKRLEKLLGQKIDFVKDSGKNILMLENLRFTAGEERNNKKFAKDLANLADIYINEAWANSHRAHSSISAIQRYLPSYAGLHLEKEIKNLSGSLSKPLILIIGGAKIETKLPVIKKFFNQADYILVGGAVANNFLKALGLDVGQSLVNNKYLKMAKKIYNPKIILPIDVIQKNGKILDIGPKTIKLFRAKIKLAKTIIWNGPMGKFEDEQYASGTDAIAKTILKSKAKIIIGGGDTEAALGNRKIPANIFVSSGGGAMLEFLANKKLPGLKKLI